MTQRDGRAIVVVVITGLAGLTAANGSPRSFDPKNPAESGYELVFSDEFESISTIDVRDTGAPGFKWYCREFFGKHRVTQQRNVAVKDGILILGAGAPGIVSLQTAVPTPKSPGWKGTAFSGGAYFEARIAFDPTILKSEQWPAFWSMAAEHLGSHGDDHWPGRENLVARFAEDDFFEFDTPFAGPHSYGGAIHDWYGEYKKTCPNNFCQRFNERTFVISVPAGTDWRSFHTFGQLWVPAGPNRELGFVQYYFDGRATSDRVTWRQGPSPYPPTGETMFNILDSNHLVLFLTTSPNIPMRIDWVHVWQLPIRAKAR